MLSYEKLRLVRFEVREWKAEFYNQIVIEFNFFFINRIYDNKDYNTFHWVYCEPASI